VMDVVYRRKQHAIFFLNVEEWRHQRNRLYKDLETDRVMRPTTAEEYPQGRLLGESKATSALRMAERAREDNERGLEALKEAIRTGEG